MKNAPSTFSKRQNLFLSAEEVRKEMRALRARQSPADRKIASQQIAKNVLSLPEITTAKKVFLYRALDTEVDTAFLISALTQQGKTLAFPRVVGDKMEAIVPDSTTFVRSSFGVQEPIGGTPISQIDVALIPALSCDEAKHRIGFGKGYYDRFLASVSCFKIALCYDFQMLPLLPTHEKDVSMDVVVTPTQIYR